MTQANTPQDPIDRLANIVERFINVSTNRMDQMEQRQDQLERAILGQQSVVGIISQAILRLQERQEQHEQRMEQQERRMEEHERRMEELRQRQAESDERFDVMLQEIRFLIRQQRGEDHNSN